MRKSVQVLKSFEYTVTYHEDRKYNKFVVTKFGKVADKFADFLSAVNYVYHQIGNFENMNLK